MYPCNAAVPPEIAVGAIHLIADGSLVTTAVLARVRVGTGAWGAPANTPTCDAASGIWSYIPSQTEANAVSFQVALYKTACTSACVTVVTTASAVPGNVKLENGSKLDVLSDDWLNNGRLDLLLDGVKATTDKLDTMVEVIP